MSKVEFNAASAQALVKSQISSLVKALSKIMRGKSSKPRQVGRCLLAGRQAVMTHQSAFALLKLLLRCIPGALAEHMQAVVSAVQSGLKCAAFFRCSRLAQ